MKQTIFFLIATISTVLFAEPVRSMLGADGSSMVQTDGHDLPDGIVAVEFLESTGTQWIDTRIQSYGHLNISASFYIESFAPRHLFGARDISRGGEGIGLYNFNINALYVDWFGERTLIFDKTTLMTVLNVKFSPFYAEVNEYKLNHEDTTELLNTTISIFGIKTNNSMNCYYGVLKCFYFSIEKEGEIVRDLIPVRFLNENDEWEGAMYDLVSGELFLNQGTGDFIIGPDKE